MDVSKNYFALFDVDVGFDIDVKALKAKYQELQKAVHPDRFANAGDQEKMLSVQQAALINDAFNVLKKPLPRAKYLLQLSGIEYDDEKNTVMDPVFLMQQMELRESIAAIKGSSDPYEAAETVFAEVDSSAKQLLEVLRSGFSGDAVAQSESIIESIRKLQFFEKLREEIENIEAELDD